jgi:hypothetical protein
MLEYFLRKSRILLDKVIVGELVKAFPLFYEV